MQRWQPKWRSAASPRTWAEECQNTRFPVFGRREEGVSGGSDRHNGCDRNERAQKKREQITRTLIILKIQQLKLAGTFQRTFQIPQHAVHLVMNSIHMLLQGCVGQKGKEGSVEVKLYKPSRSRFALTGSSIPPSPRPLGSSPSSFPSSSIHRVKSLRLFVVAGLHITQKHHVYKGTKEKITLNKLVIFRLFFLKYLDPVAKVLRRRVKLTFRRTFVSDV